MELSELSKKSYTLNTNFEKCGKDVQKITPVPEDTHTGKDVEKEGLLRPGSDIQPKITLEDVYSLCQRLYGITIAVVKELISYDDRNYFIAEDKTVKNPLITRTWPHGYVLKILNAHDSKRTDVIDAQNNVMHYLAKQGIQSPKPVVNVNGKEFSTEYINGVHYVVRLLDFIPGQLFHEVPKTNHLFFQSGEFLANIDRALKNFHHDAYSTHNTLWSLKSVPQLKEFLYVLKDISRKAIVEQIIEAFEKNVLPHIDTMEKQIIHGDFNEQNILVEKKKDSDEYRICGIIDFGDTSYAPLIFEVSIAMTYMIIQGKSLLTGGFVLAGYNMIRPLKKEERLYLKYCVAARLAQSLVMGAYTHSLHPENDYVLVTQEDGWMLMEELWTGCFDKIDNIWEDTEDKYLKQSSK